MKTEYKNYNYKILTQKVLLGINKSLFKGSQRKFITLYFNIKFINYRLNCQEIF